MGAQVLLDSGVRKDGEDARHDGIDSLWASQGAGDGAMSTWRRDVEEEEAGSPLVLLATRNHAAETGPFTSMSTCCPLRSWILPAGRQVVDDEENS